MLVILSPFGLLVETGVLKALNQLLTPLGSGSNSKTSPNRRSAPKSKPRYRSDRVITCVASTVASVVVGDAECQDAASETDGSLLSNLVEHLHMSTSMQVFAQLTWHVPGFTLRPFPLPLTNLFTFKILEPLLVLIITSVEF
jgi:hypothetical protein